MSTKNNAIERGSLCEKSQYYLFDMFFNHILILMISSNFYTIKIILLLYRRIPARHKRIAKQV